MSWRVVGVAGALLLGSCASAPTVPAMRELELATPYFEAITIDPSQESGERQKRRKGVTEEGRQAFNIFIGGAIEEGDADGYAFGLDYEYPLDGGLGIGVFAEQVNGIERSLALGAQLYWRTLKELLIVFGIGAERADDDWTTIGRIGMSYEFPFGDGYFVAPGVFYDFGEEVDVVVYGLDIGYAW